MQPLTGRSVYDEFLEKKGEGLHHIKLYYEDCQKALEEFKKKGVEVIQSGKFDEDEFYYLDTEASLGTIYEIGNNGKIREPERRYPEI
jgi:4-hydroxyphenylpyruvate dioxygenase-like putative hemolysin